jgi:hypothetical protein
VTATVEVPLVELPEASVAVNVTVVMPTGKAPGASFAIAGAGSTRSVALAPARNAATSGCVDGTASVPVVVTVIPAGTVS